MTIDDADSVEHHDDYGEGIEGKPTKRGKLKDALSRTKTKINKVKEERDAKKQKQELEKPHAHSNSILSDDVDDFLSAGRPSFASSQRPSVGSDFRSAVETSSASPRPSTSDSQSQPHPSPRRVLPISIPRIDVSASSRFPNARDVQSNTLVQQTGSSVVSFGSAQSGSLLRPDYQSRSQSASSIASADRKARIRGLTVGFADVPPVVIGEGGDEADAPPVEISRAKARARSASPQGRKPYYNAILHPEARRQMHARGVSDSTADAFKPKPSIQARTAASLQATASRSAPRAPHDDDFVPKPFARTQTGLSVGGSLQTHEAPSLTGQPKTQGFMPLQLTAVQPGATDLTKEFEMTLGLRSPISPATSKSPAGEPKIWAPTPKRAPPSYDLIEGGGKRHELDNMSASHPPSNRQQDHQNQQAQQHLQYHETNPPQQRYYDCGNVQRRPVPQTQGFVPQQVSSSLPKPTLPEAQPQSQTPTQPSIQPSPQRAPQSQTRSGAQSLPHPMSQPLAQEFYPPPPQRTATQTTRNAQKLDRISPMSSLQLHNDQQEVGVIRDNISAIRTNTDARMPLSLDTNNDGYRLVASRQRPHVRGDSSDTPTSARISPQGTTIRQVMPSASYTNSPSNYSSSLQSTPRTTQGEPISHKLRFYESINRGNVPEGFI